MIVRGIILKDLAQNYTNGMAEIVKVLVNIREEIEEIFDFFSYLEESPYFN